MFVGIKGGQLTTERLDAARELCLVPGFERGDVELVTVNNYITWVLRWNCDAFDDRL
jgi:hypothetical protein